VFENNEKSVVTSSNLKSSRVSTLLPCNNFAP